MTQDPAKRILSTIVQELTNGKELQRMRINALSSLTISNIRYPQTLCAAISCSLRWLPGKVVRFHLMGPGAPAEENPEKKPARRSI